MTSSPPSGQNPLRLRPGIRWGSVLAGSLPLALLAIAPANAHHVADVNQLQPSILNGLLSGLAHPVLGADHLLFLLALSLVALQRRFRWAIALLGIGLLGSGAGLLWPGLPASDALLACTLLLEALVLVRRLPAAWLLPAMALHGYVLSGPVFGWSSMPLLAYGSGLFLSQACLLAIALLVLRPFAARLSPAGLRWAALALTACAGAWALAAVVA